MPASPTSQDGSGTPPPSVAPAAVARHGVWLILAVAVVASLYVHELGHCSVAWLKGCPAIPTPAKEYLLRPVPPEFQNQVALGGILGSIGSLAAALWWFCRQPGPRRSAMLAGTMTVPGFYVLRFVLAGRGHDGTEFQEAQAALGFNYAGHAIDWLFVILFAMATVVWFWRVRPRPTIRLAGRLLLGSVVALTVLVLLQVINNAVFDPLFNR